MSVSPEEQGKFERIVGEEAFPSQMEALGDVPRIRINDMEYGTSFYIVGDDIVFSFNVIPWVANDEERREDFTLCRQLDGPVLDGLDDQGLFIAKGAGVDEELLGEEAKSSVYRGFGIVYQPVLSHCVSPSLSFRDLPTRDIAGAKFSLSFADKLYTTPPARVAGIKGPQGKPVNIFRGDT